MLNFQECRIFLPDRRLANSPDDLAQEETSIRDLAPVRTGKHTDALQILCVDLGFLPYRVGRNLAKHVSTTAV